jgi:hypothetical protein
MVVKPVMHAVKKYRPDVLLPPETKTAAKDALALFHRALKETSDVYIDRMLDLAARAEYLDILTTEMHTPPYEPVSIPTPASESAANAGAGDSDANSSTAKASE